MTQNNALGEFTSFTSLDEFEQALVTGAWIAAESAYVPRSNFPVGCLILAQNSIGETRVFAGCNVENKFFPATICAERNAATSAVAAGFRKFLKIALVCKKYQGPGASPCGLCRQVLTEFGCEAIVFNVADKDSNVYKFTVGELLPAERGVPIPFSRLALREKRLVRRVHALLERAHVPYSKRPQAAIFVATNKACVARHFAGVSDDNSSYGGSALAECVAMRAARAAGFNHSVMLIVSVDDPTAHNPIEGESLQVLREFGRNTKVILVSKDRTITYSCLEDLLPDSFGPESLA
jgi:cytidine deaminase